MNRPTPTVTTQGPEGARFIVPDCHPGVAQVGTVRDSVGVGLFGNDRVVPDRFDLLPNPASAAR